MKTKNKDNMNVTIEDINGYCLTYNVNWFEISEKSASQKFGTEHIEISLNCNYDDEHLLSEFVKLYSKECDGNCDLIYSNTYQHLIIRDNGTVIKDLKNCCLYHIYSKRHKNEVVIGFLICDEDKTENNNDKMNFNQLLKNVYREAISTYNDARLYEMQAQMETDENGDLVVSEAKIAFGLDNGALVADFSKGEIAYSRHGSPWLEDKPITPYLPSLGPVLRYLKKCCGIEFVSPKVTLRHQVDPLHIEPQYIISENKKKYYVGVWSHDVETSMKYDDFSHLFNFRDEE